MIICCAGMICGASDQKRWVSEVLCQLQTSELQEPSKMPSLPLPCLNLIAQRTPEKKLCEYDFLKFIFLWNTNAAD